VKTASPAAAVLLAIVAAAVYVIVLYRYSALLFQDYPNHLARAVVLADLWFHGGSHFGNAFEFHAMAYPYIAGDYLLAIAVEVLGLRGATFLWTALAVLSLPCAMLFYLRATQAPASSRVFIFLVALYLATDAFFFLGFVNFRFAIALTVVALALAQILRRSFSPMLFVIYCLTIAFGYLMHLGFILFAGAAIGSSGLFRLWRRATTLGRELCLLMPIALAVLWYGLSQWFYPAAREAIPAHFVWGGLHAKFRRLDWAFIRFDEPVDVFFLAAFLLLLLWAAQQRLRRPSALPTLTWEAPVLAVVFAGMYLALPMAFGDPTYLDVRALTCLPVFAALWCAALVTGPAAVASHMDSRAVLGGATLFLVANLCYLCANLAPERTWLAQYRALLGAIPSATNVLPIYTGVHELTRFPYLHVNSFVVTDRQALVPYLFAGDQGQPMKYFRYRDHPYAPHNTWYTFTPPQPVDWPAVNCAYDFLLVMKPFDAARIGLPTKVIAQNSSAALLAPDRIGCQAK
jgi:hypothetical protein